MTASSDRFAYSFRLGYFIHLLCDGMWARKVWARTEKDCEGEIRADQQKAFGNIKFDWYGLDQVYVKSHPGCIFWRLIASTANPPSCLPFIPDAAFHHQMDYIRGFYSDPEELWFEPRKYPYLNEQNMARIVQDAVELVKAILEKRPDLDEPAAASQESALFLLPAERLLPYDGPLGDP